MRPLPKRKAEDSIKPRSRKRAIGGCQLIPAESAQLQNEVQDDHPLETEEGEASQTLRLKSPEEGDFVVVKVKATNSKRQFHYVAKVLLSSEASFDGDVTVEFYRQSSRFMKRVVKDISIVNVEDIVTVLPQPHTDNTGICTNRMKSLLKFHFDFESFNCQ